VTGSLTQPLEITFDVEVAQHAADWQR